VNLLQADGYGYVSRQKCNRIHHRNIILLHILFGAMPLSKDFNVKWIPTFLVLDTTGKEHYRITGFTTAEEVIPTLLLGIEKLILKFINLIG